MKTYSDANGRPRSAGRTGIRPVARLFLVLVLVAALIPAVAWALSLGELRSQGVVGERFDGYAVVRQSPAPAGVQAFVDRVNAQRQQIYQERAAQQGVPPGQVGRVYAQQIFREVPAGTWFLDESGKWVQK